VAAKTRGTWQKEKQMNKKNIVLGLAVAGLALANSSAHAVDFDPMTVITGASTAFTAVAALVGSAVTLFTIIKIVKWVRK
jgi:hypothetical protein